MPKCFQLLFCYFCCIHIYYIYIYIYTHTHRHSYIYIHTLHIHACTCTPMHVHNLLTFVSSNPGTIFLIRSMHSGCSDLKRTPRVLRAAILMLTSVEPSFETSAAMIRSLNSGTMSSSTLKIENIKTLTLSAGSGGNK